MSIEFLFNPSQQSLSLAELAMRSQEPIETTLTSSDSVIDPELLDYEGEAVSFLLDKNAKMNREIVKLKKLFFIEQERHRSELDAVKNELEIVKKTLPKDDVKEGIPTTGGRKRGTRGSKTGNLKQQFELQVRLLKSRIEQQDIQLTKITEENYVLKQTIAESKALKEKLEHSIGCLKIDLSSAQIEIRQNRKKITELDHEKHKLHCLGDKILMSWESRFARAGSSSHKDLVRSARKHSIRLSDKKPIRFDSTSGIGLFGF